MDQDKLFEHLKSGATTICRCWLVERRDGVALGFTDHDRDIAFEGMNFVADGGMTAAQLSQSSGLSVDNTEALGVLSHASISEAEIAAGRFDGAEVQIWLVAWTDPDARTLLFRGSIGDITRAEGAFQADLRGLSEALNQPRGRVYHPDCNAVLGDSACGVDLSQTGYFADLSVTAVEDARVFRFENIAGYEPGWFESGRLEVLSGGAKGLSGPIKRDDIGHEFRVIHLWDTLGSSVIAGDLVRVTAGCGRRMETCRLKFNNFLNFRGFPHLPGDDWLMTYPRQGQGNSGGSRDAG